MLLLTSHSIIKIHGLGGSSRQAWTLDPTDSQKKRGRLHELLAHPIDGARNMTFTFDPALEDHNGVDLFSVDGMTCIAQSLLDELLTKRNETEETPEVRSSFNV